MNEGHPPHSSLMWAREVPTAPKNTHHQENIMNKSFAATMNRLSEEDPSAYEAIQKKVLALKSEAKNWRLQAQGKTSSVIELKEAFDGSQVEHQ